MVIVVIVFGLLIGSNTNWVDEGRFNIGIPVHVTGTFTSPTGLDDVGWVLATGFPFMLHVLQTSGWIVHDLFLL